jgi:hypothetical protein
MPIKIYRNKFLNTFRNPEGNSSGDIKISTIKIKDNVKKKALNAKYLLLIGVLKKNKKIIIQNTIHKASFIKGNTVGIFGLSRSPKI